MGFESLQRTVGDSPSYAYAKEDVDVVPYVKGNGDICKIINVKSSYDEKMGYGIGLHRDIILVQKEHVEHFGRVMPSTRDGMVIYPPQWETWLSTSWATDGGTAVVRIIGSLKHVERSSFMFDAMAFSLNEIMLVMGQFDDIPMGRVSGTFCGLAKAFSEKDRHVCPPPCSIPDVGEVCMRPGLLTDVDFCVSQTGVPSYCILKEAREIVRSITRGDVWKEFVTGNDNHLNADKMDVPEGMHVMMDVQWPMDDADLQTWRLLILHLLMHYPHTIDKGVATKRKRKE